MSTRKKYKLKRIKNFLIFYMFVCILFVASYTLSRYVETTEGTSGLGIAKFSVTVNDINVTEGNPFILNYKDITNTSEKIAPNTRGYFEFEINPKGTEVSLEYEFNFDLKEIPEEFKLAYFTINDGEEQYDITDTNIIKNELLLSNKEEGFTEDEKINIKVYWTWDVAEEITNPDVSTIDNKNISIIAVIRQKL